MKHFTVQLLHINKNKTNIVRISIRSHMYHCYFNIKLLWDQRKINESFWKTSLNPYGWIAEMFSGQKTCFKK